MESEWECVVVGGGAAGLSAALVLGRARRRTLVVDAGRQSNMSAHGIGGLLGHDGRSPAELYEMGRRELAKYPDVELRSGEVSRVEPVADGFRVELADGTSTSALRIVLATGMEYRPPVLPGLAQLWGRSVFHCPFCHGWEVRDEPLAVLANGERAVHSVLLLRGWSDDVVLLTDGPALLDGGQRDLLMSAGVPIDERPVVELIGATGALTAVAFADGSVLERRGLLVVSPLQQRSALARELGVEIADPTPIAKDPLRVDMLGRTTVPGVFAAGDVSGQLPQVAAAVAAGSLTGTAVVQSLLADKFDLVNSAGR